MTLLTFNSKYVVQSTTPVSTTVLANDTEASQTFTLGINKTVLVIYQTNNNFNSTEAAEGNYNAISVDGADVALSYDSMDLANYPNRNTTFWIGSLSKGTHVINGRFAPNVGGNTVTIDNRILLIYILNGDEFKYTDNATARTTTSATLGNDLNASFTFTPSGNCVALYLYNCSNIHTTTEHFEGKKTAINVAGTDYSQAEKSPRTDNYADSVFTCYSNSLTSISTTVNGRFAANLDANTVTISRRQLGVLLFDSSTLMDIITSDTQVTTTSNALVNDAQALISRTTTVTMELLVIAMGTKRVGTTSSGTGECYGISVDTVDKQVSRGSPANDNDADSAATCYAVTLTAGSHTVQGRFSNNNATDSAIIDSRRVIALWLTTYIVSWLKA